MLLHHADTLNAEFQNLISDLQRAKQRLEYLHDLEQQNKFESAGLEVDFAYRNVANVLKNVKAEWQQQIREAGSSAS